MLLSSACHVHSPEPPVHHHHDTPPTSKVSHTAFLVVVFSRLRNCTLALRHRPIITPYSSSTTEKSANIALLCTGAVARTDLLALLDDLQTPFAPFHSPWQATSYVLLSPPDS